MAVDPYHLGYQDGLRTALTIAREGAKMKMSASDIATAIEASNRSFEFFAATIASAFGGATGEAVGSSPPGLGSSSGSNPAPASASGGAVGGE